MKSVSKFWLGNQRIANKQLTTIDGKVEKIENQSLTDMACSVSQSWRLQYVTSQIQILDKLLCQGRYPKVDYN